MKVIVVDYGIGNIHSVVKALRSFGADVTVSSSPDDVGRADRLVLPGVGAFADGMNGLAIRGLIEPVQRFASTGRPLVGICLGMQLLLSESEEFGSHQGLDLIPGRVVQIAAGPGIKVPHTGWNRIDPVAERGWSGSLLEEVKPGTMFYFVHSFTAVPTHDTNRLADTMYGTNRIAAAIRHDNITGFQFHPEKSGPDGLTIVRRLLAA